MFFLEYPRKCLYKTCGKPATLCYTNYRQGRVYVCDDCFETAKLELVEWKMDEEISLRGFQWKKAVRKGDVKCFSHQ